MSRVIIRNALYSEDEPPSAATLWVDPNGSDHSDAYTRQQIRDGGGTRQWDTIGRAAWGSTNRSSMNPSEAAEAGDVVSIKGGASLGSPVTYETSAVVNGGNPVYLTANTGSAGNPIRFVADGYVKLAAHAANSPIVGNSTTTDYVEWYANRATGRFIIVCDGRFSPPVNISSSSAAGGVLTINTSSDHGITNGEEVYIRDHDSTPSFGNYEEDLPRIATVVDSNTFTVADRTYTAGGGATGTVRRPFDAKADTTVVNTTPDTGPVIITGDGVLIEGFDIDGGPQTDYLDNWPGVRAQEATSGTVRNCTIHGFANIISSSNSAGIQVYASANLILEHNYIYDVTEILSVKDNPSTATTIANIRFRFNLCEDYIGSAIGTSLVQDHDGPVRVYQNVFRNAHSGWTLARDDFSTPVWIYNNVFYNLSAYAFVTGPAGSGSRVWNNIIHTSPYMLWNDSAAGPSAAQVDFEHNIYFTFASGFYQHTDGAKTIAQWRTDYLGQEGSFAATQDDDPLFVSAGTDFHLQGGSPAVDLGRDVDDASTIDAGVYITGTEVIGLEA